MSELVSELVPAPSGGFTEIKRFADAGVLESMNKILAQIPEGDNLTIFAGKDSEKRIGGYVIVRKGEHWSAVGGLTHSPTSGWGTEVGIRYSTRL